MAKIYTKQTWVDEVLAGDEAYQVKNDSGVVVYSQAKIALATAVVQAGSPVSADRMNHIEDGVNELDTLINNAAGSSTSLAEKIAAIKCAVDAIADAIAISGNGIITTPGDIRSVPWTNYSDTSTIVGWDSFTTKTIFYKKVGKLVFVQFYLYGPSNSTVTSFSLPYQIATGPQIEMVISGADNGAWTMARILRLSSGATVANFYSGLGSAAWTNTGIKAVWGQFWYEANG